MTIQTNLLNKIFRVTEDDFLVMTITCGCLLPIIAEVQTGHSSSSRSSSFRSLVSAMVAIAMELDKVDFFLFHLDFLTRVIIFLMCWSCRIVNAFST